MRKALATSSRGPETAHDPLPTPAPRAGSAGLSLIKVYNKNMRYIRREALKGPEQLQKAVEDYALLSLEVPDAYTLKGGLRHIGVYLYGQRLAASLPILHPVLYPCIPSNCDCDA